MRGVFVLVIALVGCIGDGTVPCGAIECPAGDVCTPGGCAAPAAAAACAGQADLTACMTTAISNGSCNDGVCHQIVCGDGILGRGEACDDGNTLGGDGCSASCDSNETCGNGVIDPIAGEQCDDGNALSGDGCTSRCALEFETWLDVSPQPIAPRGGGGAAYDSTRNRIVVFGGFTNTNILGDTWEFDGTTWTQAVTLLAPPSSITPYMVYVPTMKATVLIGAATPTVMWTWDGLAWTELHPPTLPTGDISQLVYDSFRDRLVMWSGAGFWEFDGTTWTASTPTGSPMLIGPNLAYDSARKKTVIYGGTDANTGMSLTKTYEYDGTTIAQRSTATTPTAGSSAMMTFDATRGRTVMFGGLDSTGSMYLSDVWELDATDWHHVTPATHPAARGSGALVYDSSLAKVVLFGGLFQDDLLVTTVYNDTWTWQGTTWTQLPLQPVAPAPRLDVAMAYDARRGHGVLFGGWGLIYNDPTNDTWIWSEAGWQHRTPATSPPARALYSIAYDSHRDRVVLFAGLPDGFGGSFDDTWEWDDVTWTQLHPATAPSGSSGQQMVYDAARQVVLFYDGEQTWTWDGTTWTQLHPATSPPVREGAALSYDPVRERVVMFGGIVNALANDTWEWDGTTWTQIATTAAPPARIDATMIYDAQRRRTVLFGGDLDGFGVLDDTWEWDGTTWSVRAPTASPPGRTYHAAFYDNVRRSSIVFGGADLVFEALDDTWARTFESSLEPSERCLAANEDDDGDGLAGCADPDCWGRCNPLCPPGASCSPDLPHCGDGTCDPIEDRLICPADCP